MKKPLYLTSVLCLATALAPTLPAARRGTLKQLTAESANVVLGQVTYSSSYYGNDGEMYTDVTLDVRARVKQSRRGVSNTIRVTVRGGEIGDTRVVFSETPAFTDGEPVLLFLSPENHALHKFTVAGADVPELNRPLTGLMDEITSTAPMAESERTNAHEFIRQMENEITHGTKSAKTVETPRAATVVCYALMGPKWTTSAATYKADASIQATWIPSLNAAAGAWNDGGSPFRFSADPNSTNVITFGAIAGSASILAETRVEYSPSTNALRRFTMTISNTKTWSTSGEPNKFDLQNVTTHELGHALGLNHPQDPSCSEETMWASAGAGETKKRTLEAGDKGGLAAIYSGTPTPSPTPPPTPTLSLTSLTTFPSAPRAGARFYLVAQGTGFQSGLQFVITGGTCPATGCVVSGGSVAILNSTTAYGVTNLAAGSYNVAVRIGAAGTATAPKAITVR